MLFGVDRAADDVYDVGMVRKQLYISEEHEKALKVRASAMGISEAELVRGLLDRLLLDSDSGSGFSSGRPKAALDFLKHADRISGSHSLPEGYRFDREELYEEGRGRGHRGA